MRKTLSIFIFCLATIGLLSTNLNAETLNKLSTEKKFYVQLNLPGNGLVVGKNQLAVTVRDQQKQVVSQPTIQLTPWMPGMGHGVPVTPTLVTEDGQHYMARNVYFSMPGHWQLITTVQVGTVSDQVIFEFANIPESATACTCAPDCTCPHCMTGKGECRCQQQQSSVDKPCSHCSTGKGTCTCSVKKVKKAVCQHCTTGKGACSCKKHEKVAKKTAPCLFKKVACGCAIECQCAHCTTGKGACSCPVKKAIKADCQYCKTGKGTCSCPKKTSKVDKPCSHCTTGKGICTCSIKKVKKAVCQHCTTGKGACSCKKHEKVAKKTAPCLFKKVACGCAPECQCAHCSTGKGTCSCSDKKAKKAACSCATGCQCTHCKTGKGDCGCQPLYSKDDKTTAPCPFKKTACACAAGCQCTHCQTRKGTCHCK